MYRVCSNFDVSCAFRWTVICQCSFMDHNGETCGNGVGSEADSISWLRYEEAGNALCFLFDFSKTLNCSKNGLFF